MVVGLGSVGRRHLANLRELGWSAVSLVRTGRSTLADDEFAGWPVVQAIGEALDRRPLAVIIATPTALHLDAAVPAAAAGVHLLIEKPVSHDLVGCDALQREVQRRQSTVLVGFQYRFDPGLIALKRWIDNGDLGAVVSVQARFGEFLPSMHPWEDHRDGYAARKDLGGGVLLTLCHPFDYLRWLCGEFTVTAARQPQLNPLHLDVETCVDVSLAFASGAAGALHLNFLQLPREHRVVVVGTLGTATWDADTHTARLHRVQQGWSEAAPPPGFARNTLFLDEMRHFLACLRGEATPVCSLDDGIAALDAVVRAKAHLAEVAVA